MSALSDNDTAAEPVLQVGLADRGDSTAHLQVCLCSEARKNNPPRARFRGGRKKKTALGGGECSVVVSLTWNMHAVWLSLEAETQHSEIKSVTHPLLLLYWVFLAVLVHATFVEHRK